MKFIQLGGVVINLASVITYEVRPERRILQDASGSGYEGDPTGRTLVRLWLSGYEVHDTHADQMTQVLPLSPDDSEAFLSYMENNGLVTVVTPYNPPTA